MEIHETTIDNVLVLTPVGRDSSHEAHGDIMGVRSAVNQALERGNLRIVVDLSDVVMLGSLEIGALVGLTQSVKKAGGVSVLAGLTFKIANTFYILKVDTILPIRANVSDAIAELQKIKLEKRSMVALLGKNPPVSAFK